VPANFNVYLMDSKEHELDTLADEIGDVELSDASRIEKEGDYFLKVAADGEWTAAIQQE